MKTEKETILCEKCRYEANIIVCIYCDGLDKFESKFTEYDPN